MRICDINLIQPITNKNISKIKKKKICENMVVKYICCMCMNITNNFIFILDYIVTLLTYRFNYNQKL